MKNFASNRWFAAFLTTACAVFVKHSDSSYGEPPVPRANLHKELTSEHPPLHPAVNISSGARRREEPESAHPPAVSHPSESHGHEAPHGHEASHGHGGAHENRDYHHRAHAHPGEGHLGPHHAHAHPGEGHLGPHQEHESDPEAFGLACFLMGGVAALMMVFYLVNNTTVQGATWKVLNMTTSIFIAVLVYGTIKSMILDWAHVGIVGEVCIILGLFVVLFLGLHFILFKLKMISEEGENEDVEGVAVLAAHVTGFAAMYGFADAVELQFFEELGNWGPLILLVIAAIVLVAMIVIMDKVMDKVANADGVVDANEWKWIELCQETDDDVFCLTMSFLVTLYIRYLIRGTNKPYEPGHTGAVTQSDCNYLYLVALFFVLVVIVGTLVHLRMHVRFKAEHPDEHFSKVYPITHRTMDVIMHSGFMVCAWCFLFWGEWQLYVLGWDSTVIGGCLVVAVCLTLSSFAAVLLIYYFLVPNVPPGISRSLKSFELSLGILVGFSWERAFDVGFEEVEIKFENIEGTRFAASFLFYALNIFLFFVVAPAWRLYIFPKAKKFEKEAKEKAKMEKRALVNQARKNCA